MFIAESAFIFIIIPRAMPSLELQPLLYTTKKAHTLSLLYAPLEIVKALPQTVALPPELRIAPAGVEPATHGME